MKCAMTGCGSTDTKEFLVSYGTGAGKEVSSIDLHLCSAHAKRVLTPKNEFVSVGYEGKVVCPNPLRDMLPSEPWLH